MRKRSAPDLATRLYVRSSEIVTVILISDEDDKVWVLKAGGVTALYLANISEILILGFPKKQS